MSTGCSPVEGSHAPGLDGAGQCVRRRRDLDGRHGTRAYLAFGQLRTLDEQVSEQIAVVFDAV